MSLIPWDPWRELARVRAESDRLWSEFLDRLSRESESPPEHGIAFLPDVDLVETGSDVRVFVSAPGLVEEDIDIAWIDDWLVIRGERQPPYDPKRARSRLSEWRYGYFERRVRLPAGLSGGMKATYDDGVLTVILRKRESG